MKLEQKQQLVEALKGLVQSARAMVLLSQAGLTVGESTRFRRDLGKEGAAFRVVKNTMFARAIDGSPVAFLGKLLRGPVAVAYTTRDPVALARALTGFLKGNQKVGVVGGSLGTSPIGEADLKALASLPPAETLRAMLLGALTGVPRNFLGVLQAPARDFVGVLAARERKLAEQVEAGVP